jgi:hypothetical protein
LRAEFFPELGANDGARTDCTADAEIRAFYFLMAAIRLMESAWFTLDLGRYLSHPMNDGWVNYFDRWARAIVWPLVADPVRHGQRGFPRLHQDPLRSPRARCGGAGDDPRRQSPDRLRGTRVFLPPSGGG